MIRKLSALIAISTAAFSADETLYIALKANTTAMNYTEKVNGTILDTEKSNLFGNFGGFNVDASLKVANNFLLADATKIWVNYQYDTGNSNYVGSLLNSGQPYGSYTGTTYNTINDVRALVSQVKYTSYGSAFLDLGIGNRIWNRGLTASQKEDYIWNYWLAGIGFDFNVYERFSLGITGHYKQAIAPTMKLMNGTPIRNMNNLSTATFNLGSTYGYSLSVPLDYKLTNMFSIVGSWSLDNWTINQSNTIGITYEPPSTTNNQTLSLGLAVRF